LSVRFGDTVSGGELCAKYKAIIENEFYPARSREPGKARLKIAKDAIADFKKLSDAIFTMSLNLLGRRCVREQSS
jgi:hypothetical protein